MIKFKYRGQEPSLFALKYSDTVNISLNQKCSCEFISKEKCLRRLKVLLGPKSVSVKLNFSFVRAELCCTTGCSQIPKY